MFTQRPVFVALLCALISLASARGVLAQVGFGAQAKPTSKTAGFAGQQLGSIYRQDIGNNYTGSAINQNALYGARAQVPFVGQTTTAPWTSPGSGSVSGSSFRANKPFSAYNSSQSPTVSPYLNLFRNDLSGNDDLNYQTLVRPQLQQQQINQQQQRANFEVNRRVQSIAAQGDFNTQGSKDLYPTGHQTTFGYYGHHYPGFSQPRPRKRTQ